MDKLEVMRQEFEAWYATQNRDQVAVWHPPGSPDLNSIEYPNGRYTKLSQKQSSWEAWQAAYASKTVELAETPLLIALDYDGTYTADPEFWLEFIKFATARGHEVVVATMRNDDELDDICDDLYEVVNRVIPTNRNAKRTFLKSFGIKPHIWIDDQPHFIVVDAAGADKGKMAGALLGRT